MFYKSDRLIVMIDGANFFHACRSIGLHVDFRKLHSEFASRGKLRQMCYYTAVQETEEHDTLRPILDWLAYNGYQVMRKPGRSAEGREETSRPRASTDVEFAVDLVRNSALCDHLVLMTGNREMVYPIRVAQRNGCRVTVVSTIAGEIPSISDELRRLADCFIDLESIRGLIARNEAPPGKSPPLAVAAG
ncbi:NYN domain-containing protein [Cereibacter sphaeroides]|uniref:LabA-like NYN domain-containing protein n=1 Tax=Cereibacter sphaeroides TaxID=1063 RepID=UPI001F451465|nr:NYN domain-containing protein [Cereibacter sphaeroides]MCE6949734.1 NYN domain-containing protein [Cereibacter sphaeroides]